MYIGLRRCNLQLCLHNRLDQYSKGAQAIFGNKNFNMMTSYVSISSFFYIKPFLSELELDLAKFLAFSFISQSQGEMLFRLPWDFFLQHERRPLGKINIPFHLT